MRTNLSDGERRLLITMVSYTIADLSPVKPFTEEQPPETNQHALKLWKAHFSRHKEDTLNYTTAMAFAVDGDPIVLQSGRRMTFKDCLLELGLDNAEHIVEQIRMNPESFGRNANVLLKAVQSSGATGCQPALRLTELEKEDKPMEKMDMGF